MNKPPSNLTRLDFWTEIIESYISSYRIDRLVYFRIGNKTLVFDNDSREAEILKSKLKDEYFNQTVGVLRTDSLEVPLVVRLINGE